MKDNKKIGIALTSAKIGEELVIWLGDKKSIPKGWRKSTDKEVIAFEQRIKRGRT